MRKSLEKLQENRKKERKRRDVEFNEKVQEKETGKYLKKNRTI